MEFDICLEELFLADPQHNNTYNNNNTHIEWNSIFASKNTFERILNTIIRVIIIIIMIINM